MSHLRQRAPLAASFSLSVLALMGCELLTGELPPPYGDDGTGGGGSPGASGGTSSSGGSGDGSGGDAAGGGDGSGGTVSSGGVAQSGGEANSGGALIVDSGFDADASEPPDITDGGDGSTDSGAGG